MFSRAWRVAAGGFAGMGRDEAGGGVAERDAEVDSGMGDRPAQPVPALWEWQGQADLRRAKRARL